MAAELKQRMPELKIAPAAPAQTPAPPPIPTAPRAIPVPPPIRMNHGRR
jgi:hypothetical protein